jgi:hypothetical protein
MDLRGERVKTKLTDGGSLEPLLLGGGFDILDHDQVLTPHSAAKPCGLYHVSFLNLLHQPTTTLTYSTCIKLNHSSISLCKTVLIIFYLKSCDIKGIILTSRRNYYATCNNSRAI